MDLIERIFFAPVKGAPGSREQVRDTKSDDYRHQRRNEFETAHQILCVLHGAVELNGDRMRKSSGKSYIAGERRLLACRSRQLAETGESSLRRLR